MPRCGGLCLELAQSGLPAASAVWSLMALSVNSDLCLEWSLLGNSGHCSALALNGSVANDPKRRLDLLMNRHLVVCHFSLAARSKSARF